MSSCDLDPVNMRCWTHGIDITDADYLADCCPIGSIDDEIDDGEPYTDDDATDDIENEIARKAQFE